MFNHQMFDLIRTKLAGLWTNDLKQTGAYGPRRPTGAHGPRRPTGAALRNPADPIQAARIEAAAVKRARRADKLRMNASALPNRAHLLSYNRNSLNPFYVAK